jgi:uncharacterized membrane protein
MSTWKMTRCDTGSPRSCHRGAARRPCARDRVVRYPPVQVSNPRLCGLDALRGIAVFLMIEQHMGVWLWRGLPAGRPIEAAWPLVAFNALGGGAAPMFITLAGTGVALMVHAAESRRAQTGASSGVDQVLLRRGLVLLAFGYLLSAMTPSWFSWGSFFVLHLMGVAMATSPLWRRLPDRVLLVAAVGIAVAAIACQKWLIVPPMMTNEYMRDTSRPGGALRLAFVESQFPILPWLAPFLLGMIAGRAIAARRFSRIAILGATAMVIGGGGWAIAKLWHPPSASFAGRAFTIGLGFFPASIAIVGLLVGLVLLVIAGVSWLDARRPISERNPLVALGRASLTLLLVHVPLFREATRPVGLWHGMSAGATLATIFAFVLLAVWASRLWQRVGYRGGAEWLLRKLGG